MEHPSQSGDKVVLVSDNNIRYSPNPMMTSIDEESNTDENAVPEGPSIELSATVDGSTDNDAADAAEDGSCFSLSRNKSNMSGTTAAPASVGRNNHLREQLKDEVAFFERVGLLTGKYDCRGMGRWLAPLVYATVSNSFHLLHYHPSFKFALIQQPTSLARILFSRTGHDPILDRVRHFP